MASVKITGLRKLYGQTVALENIDISIPSGAFYTLLGPSGCGKTTLLRTIAGFHEQTAGRIAIDDEHIENLPAHRRDVGMVFQDYAVFPHLSVSDNVAFGLKQRKVPSSEISSRVAEVLETVQLAPYAKRMPHELSGGQQQRVGLARAIIIKPKVLLMDEPLSNLDAQLRVDLRGELRRIQQELGITTVYVTHDQEEALAMSDIVCVLHKGVIQQAATPLDIYLRPANRFVASFVGANNFLSVARSASGMALQSGGAELGDLLPSRTDGPVVAAIRPEALQVLGEGDTAPARGITIPAKLDEVSFIGREMEVFATTESGEKLKAVSRPDPRVIGRSHGSPISFAANLEDLNFFSDGETAARIS